MPSSARARISYLATSKLGPIGAATAIVLTSFVWGCFQYSDNQPIEPYVLETKNDTYAKISHQGAGLPVYPEKVVGGSTVSSSSAFFIKLVPGADGHCGVTQVTMNGSLLFYSPYDGNLLYDYDQMKISTSICFPWWNTILI